MTVLYVALLAITILALQRNKELLVPIILVAAIFGCGPAIGGRCLLDEILISSAIGFVALTSWRDFWQRMFALPRTLTRADAFFFVFLLYYAGQSARTFIALHEISAFVYGAYFIYLGGIYAVLKAYGLNGLGERTYAFSFKRWQATLDIVQILVIAVFAYNIAYIMQGLLADLYSHLIGQTPAIPARYATQGVSWSGSAYAILPNLLALALAGRTFPQNRRIFLFWLASLVAVAFIYDSRVALALAIVAACYAAATSFRAIWRHLLVIVIVGVIAGLSIVGDLGRAKKTVVDAASGLVFLVNPRMEKSAREGDYDRYAHFYGGLRAIDTDVPTRLFGYGLMMHRVVVEKFIDDVLKENPEYWRLYVASKKEDAKLRGNQKPERNDQFSSGKRTTSFTAMLVDGGGVGILLMYANLLALFFMTLRRFSSTTLPALGVSLVALALLTSWPIIVFLLDATLFGLFLMPAFLPILMQGSADSATNLQKSHI